VNSRSRSVRRFCGCCDVRGCIEERSAPGSESLRSLARGIAPGVPETPRPLDPGVSQVLRRSGCTGAPAPERPRRRKHWRSVSAETGKALSANELHQQHSEPVCYPGPISVKTSPRMAITPQQLERQRLPQPPETTRYAAALAQPQHRHSVAPVPARAQHQEHQPLCRFVRGCLTACPGIPLAP
jgi:hypothetical protein